MTAKTFAEYLQKIFYPYLCAKGATFPVVVFVDGHSSHFSFETQTFCEEKKIIIIALYPNSTHLIQPMDVAIFAPLKKKWRSSVHEWKYKNHNFNTLTKEHFAGLLQKVIMENVKPEYFVAGFRTCGLFPFSEDGIDYTKLIGNKNDENAEADNVAEEREIERKKFEIGFQCIGELLCREKENAFLKFYLADPTKAWNLDAEDTLGYNLWRGAYEKSTINQISSTSEENEEQNEFILDHNLEIEELHSEWLTDPDVQYFIEDANIEYMNDADEGEGPEDDGDRRTVSVLEDIIIAPARENISPLVSSVVHTETSSIPMPNDQISRSANGAESMISLTPSVTSAIESEVIQLSSVNDTDGPSTAKRGTKNNPATGPTISMAQLYDLPSASSHVVDDLFLNHMKPAEKPIVDEGKFSVPKIKGKISLHFSSPYDTHYISDIEFTSPGTSVISGKYHRDYIQQCKEEHEQKQNRRIERAKAKLTKASKSKLPKNSTPRKGAKHFDDFIISTPESETEVESEGSDLGAMNKKRRQIKRKRYTALNDSITSGSSYDPKTDNILDSSISSNVSVRPKRGRKPKRFLYTSD